MLDIFALLGVLILVTALTTLAYLLLHGHLQHKRDREEVIWRLWLMREQVRLHGRLLHDKEIDMPPFPVEVPKAFLDFLDKNGEGI